MPRGRRRAPLVFRQSNFEGELVGWIHEAIDEDAGIVINPAGLTFTSIPILDALKMSPGPIIELHISNIHRREAIYHKSLVSTVATAVIAGLGAAATRSRCALSWPFARSSGSFCLRGRTVCGLSGSRDHQATGSIGSGEKVRIVSAKTGRQSR